jgi:putative redox protein
MELEAKIDWEQGLAFRAHLGGFSLPLGGEPKVEGEQSGFRPTELLLVGLAGCTGMDVISILGKMKVKVGKFHVAAAAQVAAEHPKKFLSIVVTYSFAGEGITPEPLRKAISLSEEKYCGVRASLLPGIAISHEIILNGEKIPG